MRLRRRSRAHAAAVLAAALLASACVSRDVASPATADLTRLTSAAASVTAANRYIVHFKGTDIPADFSTVVASAGGTIDASYDGAGIAVVSNLGGDGAEQLERMSSVEAVDPDNVFQYIDAPAAFATIDVTDVSANSASDPTTAVLYPFQWNLRAIQANTAWAAGQLGSPAVKVAIIDSGIDYLHPDFAGLVDLANSASFVPAEDAIVPIVFPGREPFTDLLYHGTHVAAAVSSNSLLVAGVTSRTTLMAVKVLDVTGSALTSTMVAGFLHAVDHGANIVNMSIGVRDLLSRDTRAVRAFERALNSVFRYAKSHDVTIIVAAGNEAQDLDANQTFKVFCGATHVICVSATGPTSQGSPTGPFQNIDAPASYSNFGHTVIEVAAPGGNGTSVIVGPCSRTSLVFPACQTQFLALGAQGTSAAAPHAAGLAALLLAKHGSMSPAQLKSIIGRTADDLGPSGRDDRYGRGRINVRKALGL